MPRSRNLSARRQPGSGLVRDLYRLAGVRRLLFAASCLLATASVALASTEARACSIAGGVRSVHPASDTTLPENDRIVLSLLLASTGDLGLTVQVDGQDVAFETQTRFSEVSVFPVTTFVEIVLADGSAPEGSTVTVQSEGSDVLDGSVDLSYVVGPADDSPLVGPSIEPMLSLRFVPAEEGDTCGVPDRYASNVEFGSAFDLADGQRTRFFELLYYRADDPDAVVARGASAPGEFGSSVSTSIPGGEDVSTLCAQVSVQDARGESEVVLEDCDLCTSYPDACADADGQGCAVGGDRSVSWALGLLLLGGLARRRYDSNSAPSGSSRR